MDLSDPGVLFSSLLIGAVGMGLFVYGKKAQEPKCLGLGVAMCIFPIFVHSMLLMWGIACLCMVGAYALPRANG